MTLDCKLRVEDEKNCNEFEMKPKGLDEKSLKVREIHLFSLLGEIPAHLAEGSENF